MGTIITMAIAMTNAAIIWGSNRVFEPFSEFDVAVGAIVGAIVGEAVATVAPTTGLLKKHRKQIHRTAALAY